MEQQEKQFDAVLKKSVAMFAMLTGKPMTEREGRAFIEIFDMAETYLASGSTANDAAETFDALSTITYEGPTDEQRREHVRQLVQNPPRFAECRIELEETPLDAMLRWPATVTPVLPKASASPQVAEPLDTCGCRVGKCTCQHPDASREADIDAAWRSREIEQAEEADRIENDLRARADSNNRNRYVDTTARDKHPVGYDWQICALCREGARENSIVRCFKTEPTPEEFFELYRLYDARTHWVFINRWNAGAQRWDKYLDDYLQNHDQALRNLRGTLPPKGIKVSKGDAPRALNLLAIANTGWEKPEFAWCIGRKDGFKQYQDSEPTRVELVKASTTSYIATKQKRPEIYL